MRADAPVLVAAHPAAPGRTAVLGEYRPASRVRIVGGSPAAARAGLRWRFGRRARATGAAAVPHSRGAAGARAGLPRVHPQRPVADRRAAGRPGGGPGLGGLRRDGGGGGGVGWRYAVVTGWRPHVLTTVDTLSSQRRRLSDRLGM